MDKINIRKLEVLARHGVFPPEKTKRQLFIISASLYTDLRVAGLSDELEKTLDYGEICNGIKDFVKNNSFNLIETVAERLAEKLLIENPPLQKVWIEVEKPEAPQLVGVETVSVEIERSRHTAYLGIGSNLGDRRSHLRFAVGELNKARGCKVLRVSKLISTAPYGYKEQGDFLNGCLKLDTLLEPIELLDLLIRLENETGRIRDVRWGPRTLDLDILLYDDLVMSCDRLRIPHVEMHVRDFVLLPLSEIAPNELHPSLNKTVSELLGELETKNGTH